MSLLDELSGYGADIQDGLNRFAGHSALYEKMLKKFPDAVKKTEVQCYFQANDFEQALANAHTLKGMTGNLSLTPLYEAYTDVVALLRQGKPEEARAIFEKMLPVQEKMIACIQSHM
ncbi:MAG: Hpt domain-containing protein [Lachnospiraceae bacterium]|nr:Hpt domain-containing protein [Lachnospiraceae bacterium]